MVQTVREFLKELKLWLLCKTHVASLLDSFALWVRTAPSQKSSREMTNLTVCVTVANTPAVSGSVVSTLVPVVTCDASKPGAHY